MSLLYGYEWLNEKNLTEAFVVQFMYLPTKDSKIMSLILAEYEMA